ncbi:MAG: SufE family protein [Melioribacteraceae bacterium]|nr:MAG: SufE family protein [Melioribacteraceae bacterium]
MTIQELQNELINDFEIFTDWEDRYAFIIQLGKELPQLPEEFKTEKYLLHGCQSQVWINAKLEDEKIIIEADSDSAIVKGLIALLIKVYSGQAPADILGNPPEFLAKLGIDHHLSPTRKNGLGAMIKEIQRMAFAYNMLAKK